MAGTRVGKELTRTNKRWHLSHPCWYKAVQGEGKISCAQARADYRCPRRLLGRAYNPVTNQQSRPRLTAALAVATVASVPCDEAVTSSL